MGKKERIEEWLSFAGEKQAKAKGVCWNGAYPKSRMVTECEEFRALSFGAQVLYDVLCRLRYGLRNPKEDNSFWRPDSLLMRDAGMIRNSLKKFRSELIEGGFLVYQSMWGPAERHRCGRYYLVDDVYKSDPDRDALKTHWCKCLEFIEEEKRKSKEQSKQKVAF